MTSLLTNSSCMHYKVSDRIFKFGINEGEGEILTYEVSKYERSILLYIKHVLVIFITGTFFFLV